MKKGGPLHSFLIYYIMYERLLEGGQSAVSNIIDEIEKEYYQEGIPQFAPGDSVKVHVKVVEGTRERIQIFAGTVIKERGVGLSKTFTVRRLSYGVGVERTFPLHSPKIAKIEIARRGKVRRARLFYLRDRVGKKAKVKSRDAN